MVGGCTEEGIDPVEPRCRGRRQTTGRLCDFGTVSRCGELPLAARYQLQRGDFFFFKCPNKQAPGRQKFRVYFSRFSDLAGSEAGDSSWSHPAYWTAAVLPGSREAESSGVWGWEANRDTLGSLAGSVSLRSKPEEQVDPGLPVAPGERASGSTAGDEEGESLKDKLVAQKSRVPPGKRVCW